MNTNSVAVAVAALLQWQKPDQNTSQMGLVSDEARVRLGEGGPNTMPEIEGRVSYAVGIEVVFLKNGSGLRRTLIIRSARCRIPVAENVLPNAIGIHLGSDDNCGLLRVSLWQLIQQDHIEQGLVHLDATGCKFGPAHRRTVIG